MVDLGWGDVALFGVRDGRLGGFVDGRATRRAAARAAARCNANPRAAWGDLAGAARVTVGLRRALAAKRGR